MNGEGNMLLWTNEELKEIPKISYEEIMEKEEGVWLWLQQLEAFGISLIRGVPLKKATVLKVAERISYVRETMYGRIFDVESVPDPINIAYSSEKIDFHQDLLYYETPPGIQFLHCLKADAEGGENSFLDGFKAASILRGKHPDLFLTLTTVPATFHKVGSNHSMYYRRCIIELDENQSIIAINYSPPFMGPLSIPYKTTESFYGAFGAFTKIIREKPLQVSYRLSPGDLISFKNRRVLHARTAFDAAKGERHLQGTYVDMDEFYSRYRILECRYPYSDKLKSQWWHSSSSKHNN